MLAMTRFISASNVSRSCGVRPASAWAFCPPSAVASVKTAIAWALLALVPALAASGASGVILAQGRREPVLDAKRARTRLAAANGLLVLVPAALWLAAKGRAGELDAAFYAVQAVELVAGAVNVTLLARNMRDGFRLAGRRSIGAAS